MLFTVPLRFNLTCVCERHVSLATSHMSIICVRAEVHASGALPTRESTGGEPRTCAREYSQTNSRILSIKLANTRKRTREYSQANLRVLTCKLATTRKRTREYLQKKWTIPRPIHNRTCTKGFHCHPRSSDNHLYT